MAVDTLADMEDLFEGIDLVGLHVDDHQRPGGIAPGPCTWRSPRRTEWTADDLAGTIQNDILKEYQAQKEYVFPPRPSVRLVTDVMRFTTAEMPRWHPVSISGYHVREAGSTAAQELAFTLGNGFAYVEAAMAAGLDVDEFGPRLSFFFNAHNDFFEEIGKYRAARRIWATWMREHYGAKDDRSLLCRFHTQTAGVLAHRTTAGEQHRPSGTADARGSPGWHPDRCTPTATTKRWRCPPRRPPASPCAPSRWVAHESGVANVADPLGGSAYVEWMTDEMERRPRRCSPTCWARQRVDPPGRVRRHRRRLLRHEIAESSYRFEQEVNAGERIIVGVNAFTDGDDDSGNLLRIGQETEDIQLKRLAGVKQRRDDAAVQRTLADLRTARRIRSATWCRALIDAVQAYATEGEITDALAAVFGRHVETTVV